MNFSGNHIGKGSRVIATLNESIAAAGRWRRCRRRSEWKRWRMMTVDTAVARRWKRLRNIQGWNVMRWRRGLGFLFPLPPHICHCLFLSPPRLECRSAPPLSRPRTSVSAAVAFNASALPPRGISVRPRASVAVYLCACFPLPPSVGLQRRSISCAPAPQSPFTCCARFPLPPSVGLQRR